MQPIAINCGLVVQMWCKFRILHHETIKTHKPMASVTAFIRVSKKHKETATLRFRLRDGRGKQLFYASELTINPIYWDAGKQTIKAKVAYNPEDRLRFNKAVAERKAMMLEIYNGFPDREQMTSEQMEEEINKRLYPHKYIVEEHRQTFIEAFEEFVEERKLSEWRRRSMRVLIRALRRFELYTQHKSPEFTLSLDEVTPATLRAFEAFLRQEHAIFEKYPDVYEAVPETRKPQPRGQNTINDLLTKLRTFFIWANNVGKTTNNPFKGYQVEECIYGTPYYITIEERNKIYHTNLSRHPQLATQRDIFVFQCLIGCRVGDLYELTHNNIINGAVEYIPRKTKDGHPITVRVPLNAIAREILAKYSNHKGVALFPFTSQQQYNRDLKRIFLAGGIKRHVTILNPLTREAEQRPLYEVASSHLARRAFVGNLYKQVKDPNLVGALSGHKEGSRAFARYRAIDEDIKNELVKLLE